MIGGGGVSKMSAAAARRRRRTALARVMNRLFVDDSSFGEHTENSSSRCAEISPRSKLIAPQISASPSSLCH